MDGHAFQRLLDCDWGARCETPHFCFVCVAPVCAHCCADHRVRHHPYQRAAVLQGVGSFAGSPVLDAKTVLGCGYDLTLIQRIRSGGDKLILVCQVGQDDTRLRPDRRCHACDHRTRNGSNFCSLQCKAEITEGGPRRGAALRMAEIGAAGGFGPPGHLRDQFCTICGLAYFSESCLGHVYAHHAHHPAAGPEAIKTVVHVNGWAAVPEGVRDSYRRSSCGTCRLYQPDGAVLCPIHRREGAGHPPAAIHLLGVGEPHACHRAGCPEIFVGFENFCSLKCRHDQGG